MCYNRYVGIGLAHLSLLSMPGGRAPPGKISNGWGRVTESDYVLLPHPIISLEGILSDPKIQPVQPIEFHPNGLPPQEVIQRLLSGWICIPGVTINDSSSIVVPGASGPMGPHKGDVWVRPPQPLVPISAIVGAMKQTVDMGYDWSAVDTVCQNLFGVGVTLRKVLEHVADASATDDNQAEGERADDPVGGDGSDTTGKVLQFPTKD